MTFNILHLLSPDPDPVHMIDAHSIFAIAIASRVRALAIDSFKHSKLPCAGSWSVCSFRFDRAHECNAYGVAAAAAPDALKLSCNCWELLLGCDDGLKKVGHASTSC